MSETQDEDKRSGGVDIEGEVNVGGDIVGRDKVTQYIRQFIMSPWAWLASVVILVP